MAKQSNGTEIVRKLRQADVQLAQGKTVPEVCCDLGISRQTCYRWRNKYGGMGPDMIKQLCAIQKENARLRHQAGVTAGKRAYGIVQRSHAR